MQRHTPLARGTGFGRRQTPLARQSKARRQQQAAQRRAYGEAADAEQEECSCCHRVLPLEHSHLLTQKQYPEHRDNPLNWLLKCASCHRLWENNKRGFARMFPAAWRLIQDRIWLVGGPQALALFKLKNPF